MKILALLSRHTGDPDPDAGQSKQQSLVPGGTQNHQDVIQDSCGANATVNNALKYHWLDQCSPSITICGRKLI